MIKSTTINKIKRVSMLSLIAVGSTFAVNAANIYHNGIKYTNKTATPTVLTIAKPDGKNNTPTAYSGDIVIESPVTIDGTTYTVEAVAASAFKGNADITSIILPDDCTTIPRGCFSNCTGLKKVRLSAKLTTFNGNLFDGCSSIDSIVIPAGVTAAKGAQFQGCSSLKYLEFAESGTELDLTLDAWGNTASPDKETNPGYGPIPLEKVVINRPLKDQQPASTPFRGNATLKTAVLGDSCKSINSYMFENCAAFSEITIPTHIASIGTRAFAGTGLTSVEVPGAVSTIASATFLNCKSLASVVLNEGTTSLEEQAFMGSSALTTVALPQSLTKIGSKAFSNCNITGDIVLPGAVKTVSGEAFADNKAITSMSFPATLSNLGESAFRGCSSLASFAIDAANGTYKVNEGNAIVTIDGTKVMAYPAAATATSYTDATATTIAAHAFYGAKNLAEIKIDNCTNFGDYSLAGTSITKMNLRNTIGRYVLQNCTSLTDVVLENGKEIPFGVCQGCTALTSFVSNEDPLTIKQEAFAECTSLATLNLGGLLCILETDAFRGCGVKTMTTNCAMPASMAAGVFTADNADITVYVPEAYADKYKTAEGWSNLNIQPDATLVATGTSISMPKGLYYAGTDGMLHCVDADGYETKYDVGGVPHTFQLLEFQNRIYGASAGDKFTYVADATTTGDGKLFYISQIDGNTFQAVVIDNTGNNAYKDPMGLYIYGDVLYVNDRNVCVRKVSAYSLALPTSYPSWMENNWMAYYGNPWAYGCIKAGFAITQDVDAAGNPEPLYWVGMRYNGNGIYRFKESHIGNADAAGAATGYSAMLNGINVNLSAFYIDEKNDHFYIYIVSAKDVNAGLYRVKYSDIIANPEPAKFADLNPVLVDGAPIKLEGAAGSQETGITQLTPSENGEYLYWCYISPESATASTAGTPAETYDEANPMHQSGIKRIKLGEEVPTVEMLVPGAKGYGIVPVDYENSSAVESIEGAVAEANRLQVIGNAVTVLEDATLNIYSINGTLVSQAATTGVESVSLENLTAGLYVVEAVFADGSKEVVKVIR